MPLELVAPTLERLPAFVEALQRGWSPDSSRGPEAAQEMLGRIDGDRARFIAEQDDPDGAGPPIVLPDGATVARLPGFSLWMWDGEFCGRIGARWRAGTTDLPPHCLGHVGYGVVPWKRRRGYATEALRLALPRLRTLGLPYVDLTTDGDNLPSQRVILANGGRLIGPFTKPEAFGGGPAFLFRLNLA